MKTHLLTWNPQKNHEDDIEWVQRVIQILKLKGRKRDQWSTGVVTDVKTGAKVFLLRQGHDEPGLVASGRVVKGSFKGPHWDKTKAKLRIKANYVMVEWDAMVSPENGISRARLLDGLLPDGFVNAQASGRIIPEQLVGTLLRSWQKQIRQSRAKFMKTGVSTADGSLDDTYDDLGAEIGSDAPKKKMKVVSGVARDARVRRSVIYRSRGRCERAECKISRGFRGFFDVHHILGAAKSDRVWNCVALCPNCHREAHYSAEASEINRLLLIFADQFRAR